eukprot:274866-Pyramimonas_sp.AAC.1
MRVEWHAENVGGGQSGGTIFGQPLLIFIVYVVFLVAARWVDASGPNKSITIPPPKRRPTPAQQTNAPIAEWADGPAGSVTLVVRALADPL